MKHFVFATKVVNRNAYSCNTSVLDTGATDHIIYSATLLTTITSITHSIVELPNGESAQVTHIDTIQLSTTLILDNALCVPSFSFNLLSISKLTQKLPYCLVFVSQFFFIPDLLSWKTIGIGEVHHGLYLLQRPDCVSPSSLSDHLIKNKLGSSSYFVNVVRSMPRIWYFRLGHPSLNKLVSLQDSLFVYFDTCTDICNICPMAKQKSLPFSFNNNFFDSPFDLFHVHIWGPYSMPTHDGFKYFLSIVDDATRCTWIYLLRAKSNARAHLISFHKMVETQFKANIKLLYKIALVQSFSN